MGRLYPLMPRQFPCKFLNVETTQRPHGSFGNKKVISRILFLQMKLSSSGALEEHRENGKIERKLSALKNFDRKDH